MEKLLMTLGALVLFVLMVVFFGGLFAIFVQLLWNWVAVDIFAVRAITFTEAWGLLVLCGFLFKPSVASSSK